MGSDTKLLEITPAVLEQLNHAGVSLYAARSGRLVAATNLHGLAATTLCEFFAKVNHLPPPMCEQVKRSLSVAQHTHVNATIRRIVFDSPTQAQVL